MSAQRVTKRQPCALLSTVYCSTNLHNYLNALCGKRLRAAAIGSYLTCGPRRPVTRLGAVLFREQAA